MSYPQQPENWTDPSWPSPAPGFDPKAPYGDPSAMPVSGQQPGGYPAGYPGGYPAGYGYPVAAAPPTNSMAIASMVISIVGALGLCFYGLGGYLGIVGAIMGHVARRQVRERGEQGDGMALAGVIVGWIATVIAILATAAIVIFFVWIANQDPSNYEYDSTTY